MKNVNVESKNDCKSCEFRAFKSAETIIEILDVLEREFADWRI